MKKILITVRHLKNEVERIAENTLSKEISKATEMLAKYVPETNSFELVVDVDVDEYGHPSYVCEEVSFKDGIRMIVVHKIKSLTK